MKRDEIMSETMIWPIYLDKDKAEKRYEDELRECGYLDVQMDYYPVDG